MRYDTKMAELLASSLARSVPFRAYLRQTRGRKRAGTVDALIDAAKADRVRNVMRPYIEALV